ncbi:hypothetical protein ACFX12_033842 [Malus domestica]
MISEKPSWIRHVGCKFSPLTFNLVDLGLPRVGVITRCSWTKHGRFLYKCFRPVVSIFVVFNVNFPIFEAAPATAGRSI